MGGERKGGGRAGGRGVQGEGCRERIEEWADRLETETIERCKLGK